MIAGFESDDQRGTSRSIFRSVKSIDFGMCTSNARSSALVKTFSDDLIVVIEDDCANDRIGRALA
jgi:Sec7-like guanine-nucleotide exchange factor